jgi:hypothetical protein
MGDLQPGHWITLALAAVGFIAWLVRLESKVQSQNREIELVRSDQKAASEKYDADLRVAAAKSLSDAKAAQDMRETLIRMDERLIHLTDLVEKLAPKRRAAE